jgi:hypothetical protein
MPTGVRRLPAPVAPPQSSGQVDTTDDRQPVGAVFRDGDGGQCSARVVRNAEERGRVEVVAGTLSPRSRPVTDPQYLELATKIIGLVTALILLWLAIDRGWSRR